MPQTLTLVRPDDWHLHLRDGDVLKHTVAASAASYHRAVIMPNLVPPITSVPQALAYRERILSARPAESDFQPLMSLYLTDQTTVADITAAAEEPTVIGCKLYPAGATTNSAAGVTDLMRLQPILEKMAELGVVLQVHGEVVDDEVDIFDREQRFIDEILAPLVVKLPQLKLVFEHISTSGAVAFVREAGPQVAATVTAHHLLFNRNHMLTGGIRPHYYCLPILKRESHRSAIAGAVAEGHPRFFLGTDSAPHARHQKESPCGCAGCFSAPASLALYAQAFEELDALQHLEGFASFHGPDFYGLPRNRERITLQRQAWQVPDMLQFGQETIIPFQAGSTLAWQQAQVI